MTHRLLLALLVSVGGLVPALSEEVPYFRSGSSTGRATPDVSPQAPALQVTGFPSRATAGDSLAGSFVFANAIAPVTYAIMPGTSFPDGVTLGSDGSVTGTPRVPGTYSVTVQAKDAAGRVAQASIPIVVLPPVSTLGAASARPVFATGLYSVPVTSSDGGALSGLALVSAPDWLVLNGAGVLGRVPAGINTFAYGISALDAYQRPVTGNFTVSATAPTATVSMPRQVRASSPFTATLTSNLGEGAWSVAGMPGLVPSEPASPSTTVSGTAPSSGFVSLDATRTRDDGATASGRNAAPVVPALTARWGNGTVVGTLSPNVQAYGSGESANAFIEGVTWSAVPTFPAAFTVSASGEVKVAANATGEWYGVLQATDLGDGATAPTANFAISVQSPVALGTVANAAVPSGSNFSIKPSTAASGGSGGYVYYLRNASNADVSSSPPFGNFNKTTGIWSGTAPASYASQAFAIHALDIRGRGAQTGSFLVSVDIATVANTCFTLTEYYRTYAFPVAANGFNYRYNYAENAGQTWVYGSLYEGPNRTGNYVITGSSMTNHTGPAGFKSGYVLGDTKTGYWFDRGSGTGSMSNIEIIPTYNGVTKGPC